MNIFWLDKDPNKNAEYHIDKHVVKMPTEVAQLLTTTIWVDQFIGFAPRALDREELAVINAEKIKQPAIDDRTFTRFLPTHINHPCAVWVRSSLANYESASLYLGSLDSEYRYRYEKQDHHKSSKAAFNLPEPRHLLRGDPTKPPQCMPEEYQDEDLITAYRLYYMADKAKIATWKNRDKPEWWDEYLVKELAN